MEAKDVYLLKLAEEVKISALEGNIDRCERKLIELKSHLDNLGYEDDKKEVKKYIDSINVSNNSDIHKKLVHFTDSIIGKYISDSFSDLTPTDVVIIEDADVNLEELFKRGSVDIIDREDIQLNQELDEIVRNKINPRFDLEITPENISHDMKVLLVYLILEYNAVLDVISDEINVIPTRVENRKERIEEFDKKLQRANESLQEIVEQSGEHEYDGPSDEATEIVEELQDDEAYASFVESMENLDNADQNED
jgi:hypothetical protein